MSCFAGSTHSDNASVADVSGTTPNVSMQIPALYSESMHDDQEMPPLDHSIHLPQMNLESLSDTTMPHPSWSTKDDLMSLTTSVSQMSESCMSDISLMGKETVGMLEQVFHELALIKGRNNLLEKTVEQANEWRNRADKLEEQNRILQKSLKSSRNKVEQFTQEVEQLKQREEQLSLSLKQVELLREHRSCEQLKEQLHLMNELVEKLEAEHAAEVVKKGEEAGILREFVISYSISEDSFEEKSGRNNPIK
ncbi:ATP synthase F0, B subunit domain protein [Oesophagostomum dentatum]|uniref:ATP synthase F0, B subunit domain protein n=1 Tax=Oesophagostomum dentatum TaxID=61180 RepID=A0A0B1SJU0_OESDE|nr:ATP synthase F0, B subunit domain protein [Oesophagostomum dentatum]